MAGFSEEALNRRLDSLSSTLQSIQTLSMWLLHHGKKHANIIVKLWLKEVTKETRPGRLVNLLYVANDVIQTCRRVCPDYTPLFYNVLEPAFRHVGSHADSQAVVALKKVIRVFGERRIYSQSKVDRLIAAVTSSLDPVRLIEFNADIGPSSSNFAHDLSNRTLLTPTTPPNVNKSFPTDSYKSPLTPPSSSPERKKTKMNVEKFDPNVLIQTAIDLTNVYKKLEDHPPSADAQTRKDLADIPESVANPSSLKSIRNEEHAQELLRKIDDAEPAVKDYCKRLAEELEDRRYAQRLLDEYHDLLETSIVRNAELLKNVTDTIEKLEDDKAAAVKHLQSLPDLSELPVDARTPLPSFLELFKDSKSLEPS